MLSKHSAILIEEYVSSDLHFANAKQVNRCTHFGHKAAPKHGYTDKKTVIHKTPACNLLKLHLYFLWKPVKRKKKLLST